VSDAAVEHAVNNDVGPSLVKQATSASEDVVSSAHSRDQSLTSLPVSARDIVHSSLSEDLRGPSQRQSRSSVVEDLPDTGQTRGTATSLAEELPSTGRSSKALSSVAEDAKMVSASKSESRKSESRLQSHGEPETDSGPNGRAEDVKSVLLSKTAEKSAAVVRSQTSEHQHYSSDDESVATEIDSEAKYVCVSDVFIIHYISLVSGPHYLGTLSKAYHYGKR